MDRYIDFLDDIILGDIGSAIDTFDEYATFYEVEFTGNMIKDREIVIDYWRKHPDVLLVEYQYWLGMSKKI